MKRIIALIAFALAAGGCAETIGNLTVASTKNVDLSAPHEIVQRGVKGEDGRGWFLFFPLGGAPSINAAMDDALAKSSGDYMTSVRIREGGWWLILFGHGWVEVEGDATRVSPEKIEYRRETREPAPPPAVIQQNAPPAPGVAR